jgi:hypothetical protein
MSIYCILLTPKQLKSNFLAKNNKANAYKHPADDDERPPTTVIVQWAIDQIHSAGGLPIIKRLAITTGNRLRWFGLIVYIVFIHLILIGFILHL